MTLNIPNMDNLQAELDQLTDQRLDYVRARSMVNTDSEGYRNAGIAKASFYTWPSDEREKLNAIAQWLKRQTVVRALMVMQDAAEEAARIKVSGLKSRDERIRQSAATDILDRNLGKPSQSIDMTSGGEKLEIVVTYANKRDTTDTP